MSRERLAAFDRFDSRMLTRRLNRVPDCLVDEYDLFSVGSDQVWNPLFIKGYEDWYFLKFARPEQRVAVAPSIGLSTLTDKQAAVITKGVEGFTSLSIREKRGAELIERLAGVKAEVLCDPTLTVSPEEWRLVSDASLVPESPYIFTYLLGGVGPSASAVLDFASGGGDIPVVHVTDREKPTEPPAGPAELIALIDHASHVVTDSFHAAVFSCLLETPLTIVNREGSVDMFSRLETLTSALGIEDKVYGGSSYDPMLAGRYDVVAEKIVSEHERFETYLNGVLGSRR